MKYCKYCGSVLKDESLSCCADCATALKKAPSVQPVQEKIEQPQPENHKPSVYEELMSSLIDEPVLQQRDLTPEPVYEQPKYTPPVQPPVSVPHVSAPVVKNPPQTDNGRYTRFSSPYVNVPPVQQPPKPVKPVEPPKKKSRAGLVVTILVLIAVLALVFWLIIAPYMGMGNGPDPLGFRESRDLVVYQEADKIFEVVKYQYSEGNLDGGGEIVISAKNGNGPVVIDASDVCSTESAGDDYSLIDLCSLNNNTVDSDVVYTITIEEVEDGYNIKLDRAGGIITTDSIDVEHQ